MPKTPWRHRWEHLWWPWLLSTNLVLLLDAFFCFFIVFCLCPFSFTPLLSHKKNKINPLTHFWYFAFVFGTWNVDMSLCKLHFFFCYCDNKLGLVLIVMLFVLSVCEGVEIFFVFMLLWCKRSGNNQFSFFFCFLLLWCDARCGNLSLTSPWVIVLVFDFFFWFLVGFVLRGWCNCNGAQQI
jgi:hypothetical protein